MKNKKGFLLGVLVGLLLCGTTVYATSYLASDITYKDTTVEAALNDLYDNKKCVTNTMLHEENSQINIPLDFIPTSFQISYLNSQGYVYYIYNKNVSSNIYSFSKSGETLSNVTKKFTISNSIISKLDDSYITYREEFNMFYTACK